VPRDCGARALHDRRYAPTRVASSVSLVLVLCKSMHTRAYVRVLEGYARLGSLSFNTLEIEPDINVHVCNTLQIKTRRQGIMQPKNLKNKYYNFGIRNLRLRSYHKKFIARHHDFSFLTLFGVLNLA
jgi:hypothetical protein